MKLGIWLDFRNPPAARQPWSQVYHDNLSLAVEAEQLGFESVWLSEHHLTDDGYCPSLLPVLAAIAARTQHVRLGTAVLLAPLHHPLRLAEDTAVVDQLSNGRLELGLGLGYRRHEFDNLGIPYQHRGIRTEETIDVLRRAWTGHEFSFHGSVFNFDRVTVTPPPHQAPHPPILIGGSSPTAAKRAARYGCHFLPDISTPPQVIDQYRATLAEHGHQPANFHISIPTHLHPTDNPDAAWEQLAPSYLYASNLYRTWAGRPPLASTSDLDPARYLIGPPTHLTERLQALQAATGCTRVIFWARPPGQPVDQARQTLRLVAEHVAPHLR